MLELPRVLVVPQRDAAGADGARLGGRTGDEQDVGHADRLRRRERELVAALLGELVTALRLGDELVELAEEEEAPVLEPDLDEGDLPDALRAAAAQDGQRLSRALERLAP